MCCYTLCKNVNKKTGSHLGRKKKSRPENIFPPQPPKLRGHDTTVRFSAILMRETTFVTSCLLSYTLSPLSEKESTDSKRKDCVPTHEEQYLSFKCRPLFRMGIKTILIVTSPESVSTSFKPRWNNNWFANHSIITVFTLSIRTDRPEQTVKTQIRRRCAASDQGLHCCQSSYNALDISTSNNIDIFQV